MKLLYKSHQPLTKAHSDDLGFDLHPESCTILFRDGVSNKVWLGEGNLKEIHIKSAIKANHNRHPFLKNKRGIAKLIFDTGVSIAPESGSWAMAVPNSRVCKTASYVLQNSMGIIDPGYRGRIKMTYLSTTPTEDIDDILMLCRTCGQLVIFKAIIPEIEQVSILDTTERGEKGFGSSDVKI